MVHKMTLNPVDTPIHSWYSLMLITYLLLVIIYQFINCIILTLSLDGWVNGTKIKLHDVNVTNLKTPIKFFILFRCFNNIIFYLPKIFTKDFLQT